MMQVDTRWLDGSGYRPVRVRVTPIPPGPAPADRRLQITLRPRGWSTGTSRATVTGVVDLQQGDLIGGASLAIPHHEGWSAMDVEVREDGRILPDLTHRHLGIVRRSYYEWSEATPTVLFIDTDAPRWPTTSAARRITALPADSPDQSVSNRLPDLRGIAGRIPMHYWHGQDDGGLDTSKPIEDSQTLRLLRDWPRLEIVPPVNLPDRWIELTCVDMIVVSRTDLELLISQYPQKWLALRAWTATGATLCVTGVDLDEAGLAALESRTEAQPLENVEKENRGWWAPDAERYSDRIDELNSQYQSGSRPIRVVRLPGGQTSVKREDSNARTERKPSDPRPFLWRSLGPGILVAIGSERPFAEDPNGWCWLFNSISKDNWMWYRRHGLSMFRENPDYWNLLIPDVGEAPVNSFLVLISLFVIVIGPLNYFILQRQGRLYLLLVTVPAGAFLVTVGLFAYALFTDGLAVRARVRSYTEIDQRTGNAVAWSRQTYYAGMAPSGGIAFPTDAAVYPVEFRPFTAIPSGRRWHTVWDGSQRLAEGFLPSRTTTQFLVVESRATEAGLDIEAKQDGELQLTNRLGSQVLRLLLRDSAGEYYQAEAIRPGARTLLEQVDPRDVAETWNAWFARARPEVPSGFDPYQMENVAEIFESGRNWSGRDGSLQEPTFRHSLFGRRWSAVLRQDFRLLQSRSYLAIVESSPEVSLGTDQAREQASMHIVLGRW